MPKYKVGDRLLVKLSGGRIVEATVKAIVERQMVRACKWTLGTMKLRWFMSGRSSSRSVDRVRFDFRRGSSYLLLRASLNALNAACSSNPTNAISR
jgi:hypothetical protein